MVADLVHQHVGDDGAQRLVVLGPVVEDRPAVEPDHVRHLRRTRFPTGTAGRPLKQAEQVEFALRLEFGQHLLGREIIHPDDESVAKRPELDRKPAKCRVCERSRTPRAKAP